ncbi:hypothetical protein ElyMa_005685500 [Elysia marginata]|uniref:Uncharacterized protein n=1 Tax=Elysia marginata TaxID=1093978 RepID=A0AAV4FH37_9GAST|nr:hypothetical protein ElyMa_005685500 [Elysia marginata]
MKTRITGFLVLLVMIVAGWQWLLPEPVPDISRLNTERTQVFDTTEKSPDVEFNWTTVAQVAGISPEAAEQAYQQWMSREQQYDDVIRFFNGEKTDPEKVMTDIKDMAERAEISAGEALFLELAWLNQTETDADVIKEKAARLIENSVQASAEQRQDPTDDPQFQQYKTLEAELVKEVMTMEQFPDEKSRSRYLSMKLQELREKVYAQ